MAWLFDTNRTWSGAADATGGLLYHLKRMLVQAGWTVRGSGDGDALFEDQDEVGRGNAATGGAGTGDGGIYDVITSDAGVWGGSAVAGEMANWNAWFRVREPGSTREFIFQRDQTTQSFGQGEVDVSIKFSPTGFQGVTETPSATLPPTAVDERILWGSFNPANGAPLGDSAAYGRAAVVHVMVSDTAINGVYPWYTVRIEQGVSNVESVMIYEALTGGQAGDTQPHVWITGADAFIGNYNGNLRGYRDFGGPNQDERFYSLVGYKDSDNSQMAPAFTPVQDDGSARSFPIPVWDANTNQFKGFCSTLRWKGSSTRLYPDTQDLASADAKLYVADILFPWETSTTPDP